MLGITALKDCLGPYVLNGLAVTIGKSKDPEEISFSILARIIEFKNSHKEDMKKIKRQVNEF